MNIRMLSRLAAIAIGLAAVAGFAACNSDDTNGGNPTPTPHDSGTTNQVDANQPSNPDGGAPSEQDSGGVDSNLPDVGSCATDAAHCNSCYTPQQDPKNGCSPAVVNCQPFDNGRVPTGAP